MSRRTNTKISRRIFQNQPVRCIHSDRSVCSKCKHKKPIYPKVIGHQPSASRGTAYVDEAGNIPVFISIGQIINCRKWLIRKGMNPKEAFIIARKK